MEKHTGPKPKPTKDIKEPVPDEDTEEPPRKFHVRMSRPGDRMQEVLLEIVDPATAVPHDQPLYKGIRVTDRFRPDMERRSRRPKFNFRDLQIKFMALTEVYDRGGVKRKVGLRRGDANHWGPEDVVPNAVDEYDIPERFMHKFAPFIKLGHAVVDPLPEDAEISDTIPGREIPVFGDNQGSIKGDGATVKPFKAGQ